MLSTGRIATVMMVIRITRNIKENIDSSGRKMYLKRGWIESTKSASFLYISAIAPIMLPSHFLSLL